MRGKSRKLLATLLTIFMLITNSSEVLAATNISGNIDKAASQMSSLASLIDSKLSSIEGPKEKEDRNSKDLFIKERDSLINKITDRNEPKIESFRIIDNKYVEIRWNRVSKTAEYELSINDKVIKVGKAISYLDADTKENKKYQYKVRDIIDGKVGNWSEIKVYDKTSVEKTTSILTASNKLETKSLALASNQTQTISLGIQYHITYKANSDNLISGWYSDIYDDETYQLKTGDITSGIFGPSNKGVIDAIKIKLKNSPTDMGIKYQVCIKDGNNISWENWKANDEQAGIVGKEIKAIKIKIDGNDHGNSINYRAWASGEGGSLNNLAYNGETSGSEVSSDPSINSMWIELSKMTVIDKDTTWSGEKTIDGSIYIYPNATLTINPGSNIKFVNQQNELSGFVVDGKLIANGQDASRIKIGPADGTTKFKISIGGNAIFQGSNLDISGNVTGTDSLISNAGGLILDKSTLSNSVSNQGIGALGFANVASMQISNSSVSKFQNGIEFDSDGIFKISSNNISDNYCGVYLHTRVKQRLNAAEISKNTFNNDKIAIEITDGDTLKKNVLVSENILKSSVLAGIRLSGGNISNVDIQKNQITATNISKSSTDNTSSGPIVINGWIDSDSTDLLAKVNYIDSAKANTLSGNNYDAIVFGNATVTSNCVIEKGKNNILINDSISVAKGAILKLDKGVVLNSRYSKTQDGKYNNSLFVEGKLVCSGTSAEPVVITSVNDKSSGLVYKDNSDPIDTNFSSIYIKPEGLLTANNLICRNGISSIFNNGQVILNNSNIENATTGVVNNSQLNIINSAILNCKTGIDNDLGQGTIALSKITSCETGVVGSDGKINVINNIFQDCGSSNIKNQSLGQAILFVHGDSPQIVANSFLNKVGNATALYNLSGKIDAKYNYWGKDVGPNDRELNESYNPAKGLFVKGKVDYSGYSDKIIKQENLWIPEYNDQMNDFITQQEYAIQRHFGEAGANTSTGNYSKTAKDMAITTPGLDIDIYRTYNSKGKDKPSIIGSGWRFSYESSIKDIDANAGIKGKIITLPNGSVQSFELKSDGTYVALDSRNKLVYTNNQYTLTSKTNDKYVFTNNLLTEIRDNNDNKLTISYDSSNNISAINDESGRSYLLSYTNGKLSTITEKIAGVSKRTITYNYSNNLLQSVTDMNGHITEAYFYDAQSRLNKVTKESQVVEEITYFDDANNKDKIKTYKNSDGNVETYEYDNSQRMVKITDSNSNVRQQYYDSSMFNTCTINADGSIDKIYYEKDENGINKYGEEMFTLDSLGNTRMKYRDENGNVTTEVNPDNSEQKSTYVNNNLVTQTDENGNTTYYTYDANGNMTKKIIPLNGIDVYSGTDGDNFAIEKYEYYTKQEMQTIGGNIAGLLKTKTDANGGVTKYTYDKSGNPSTITDEEGNVTQFTYNEFGFKTAEISPNQFKTTYTYTNTGDLLTTTYHDGSIRKSIYDALGRKIKDITPNLYSQYGDTKGSETAYYPNGRIKSTKDEVGNVKEYTYDLYGNINTEKAPNGSIYVYEYDNMNRVVKKSFKENVNSSPVILEAYIYEIIYGNEMKNNNLKVSKKAYIDSTNFTTSSVLYNYNKQIVQTVNEDQTTTKTEFMRNGIKAYETDENDVNHYYNYDKLNRLVSEYRPVDNSSGEVLYSYYKYDYDKNGNKIKESVGKELVKKGAVPTSLVIKEYSYYKNGRLKAQWDNEGRKSEYEYDGNGNVNKQTIYTNKNGEKKIINYSNNYLNKPYKKSEQVVSGDIFGNAITNTTLINLDTTYNYDLNGNLIKQTSPDGHEISYGYDNVDRQISITEKTLDETGTQVVSTTTKAYEWNGQIKEAVDAKGNKTQYQYDAMGVQVAEVNAKGDKTTYQHDLLGRITEKVSAKDRFRTKCVSTNEIAKYYDTTEKSDNWNPKYDLNHDGVVDIFDAVIAGRLSTDISIDELNTHYGSKKGDSNWDQIYDLNLDGIVDILDVVMLTKNIPSAPVESEYPTKDRLIYNSRGWVIAEQRVEYPKYNSSEYVTVMKAYKYDNKGNRIKELDASGYDSGTGTSVEEKINSGYGKEYQYNLSGKLVTETTAATKDKGLTFTHKYQYDALLRMVKDTDANNNAITYDYNNAGKVTSKKLVSASGTKELARYEYDLLDNVTLAVDGNGNKTTTTYNSLNKPKQTILPGDSSILGDSIVYQYDKLGNQVFSQNSKGIISKNQRDPQGKILITTNTDAAGTSSINQEVKYDKNGNKRFVKDGNGNVTTYEYDELNRIKSTSIDVKNVNGVVVPHKTSYEYDANGNITKETDYLGNSKIYNYDIFNRIIEKYDGANKLIERLEYNKNGTQKRSVDALGNSTRFEYDKDNRLISKTDAENNKSSQTYDKLGNVDTRTDAKGNKTVYSYDELNRLKSVLNAKSESTTYTYDNNGNMLEQTDAKGNKTIYEYNVGNKVSKIISPKGKAISGTTITYDATKVQEFTYYENGNVKTHKDQNGVVTQYSYDIFGRETSEITPTATISFEYDKNGNQTKMTDSTGVTLREYDALNRVIAKTVPNIGKSTYLYDVKDGVDLGFYAEISKDPKANSVKKVYDKSDRLVKVIDGTSTTAYEYYDNGAKKSTVYPDGSREDYQYNKNNTLKTLVNKNSNATVIESFSYTYDAAGNISSKTDKKGQTNYEYDALNRITSVKEPGGKNTSYTYDLSGNRQTETVVQNNVTNITTYSYDEQNHLIQTTKMQGTTVLGYKKYFYDNNGNVTKEVAGLANFVVPQAVSARMSDIYNSPEKTYDIVNSEIKDKVVAKTVTTLISSSIAADNTQFNEKIVQYSYDNFNQLTEAKNDTGTILKNTYNGEGLRVSKEQGAQKTNLLYEGNQVVLEVDGATGTEKARNVYGNNLISRKSGTTTAYYMYNGHGDVTNLLDGKGGIIGSYYYDAFGNVQENTSTFSNPYRYAGYQYDEEIGKYYLLNRMYDPESARFMQEDTYRGNANDPLSLNLYTYVNNNPMIYDDQNGHWPSFVDNFVSGVKSVVSNVVSSVKEAVSYVGSKISSAVSSGVSYLANTSVGKAVTSTISKGKQIYNTVTSVNKATSIVYNKVIKPQVERDTQQKVEALKKGISVVSSVGSIIKDLVIPKVEFKANNISNSIDYVRGLDLNKLLYGDMPVVAETNVKYDYSPRTGGTLGDKAFNFWTSTPAFKGLDWLSEFQENNPEAMNVANAFMFYKGLKNPLAAEEKVQRSEREIEKSLKSAIKGAGNPERQLLSGSEWNNYFKEAYGAENVTWEGTETLYRTMSKSDYEALAKTGNLRYTRETFTSTSQAYAAQYDGVLVEFKLKQGTMNSLEGIGARETNNPFLRNLYPDMPEIKNVSNWRANNAYFKREGGVLNIGLGQKGKALDTFNNNIIHFEVKK